MSSSDVPLQLIDLLERPIFGVLGTISRDDTVNTSPMWFEFDGTSIRFTHTTTRAKYRNLKRNPSMSLTVYDPERPYRYLEVRGRLTEVAPDPTGAFFQQLARRYGDENPAIPSDVADRVILTMSIERAIGQ